MQEYQSQILKKQYSIQRGPHIFTIILFGSKLPFPLCFHRNECPSYLLISLTFFSLRCRLTDSICKLTGEGGMEQKIRRPKYVGLFLLIPFDKHVDPDTSDDLVEGTGPVIEEAYACFYG